MPWNELEVILRPALAARAIPPAPEAPEGDPGPKGAAEATRALMWAWSAYQDADEELDENMRPGTLARKVAEFALRRELTGAHLINPNNPTTRDLMKCALAGIRQGRDRDRR
jgi:hypothetical protein